MNTAISDRVIEDNGEADVAGADQRRLAPLHPLFHVALDVFQHDDGVIDDKAGRNGQRHQRQVVQRIVEKIHGAESADDGDGHGDGRNQRGAAVLQEDEDHADHQAHGDDQGPLGLRQRIADRRRAVGGEADFHRLGQRRPEFWNGGAHGVDGLDDIGAGLPEDDKDHRRAPISQSEIAQVLGRIHDLRHVAEPKRVAVPVGDDLRPEIGGPFGLVRGVDLPAMVADVDGALGRVGVGRPQGRTDVLEADAEVKQFQRIELDPHRRQGGPADDHLSHA